MSGVFGPGAWRHPGARRAAAYWSGEIERASAGLDHPVRVDPSLLHRTGDLPLGPPGVWSSNHSCRMVRAKDAWLAVSLPRFEDLELVAAWLLLSRPPADPWAAVVTHASRSAAGELVDQARRLGLPVSRVGETQAKAAISRHHVSSAPVGRLHVAERVPRVVDLTSLWAGPLCTALLAEAGAEVTRYESSRRPDPSRTATPAFYERLNGRKARIGLDFIDPADRDRLVSDVATADVLVTSARPRAFDGLGLHPAEVFARNPRLIWVAITAHGWTGAAADRVGFGDDAAAAGGLVRWTAGERPRFAGDALADPLTGLAAAAATFDALAGQGGVVIDMALARVAAHAAGL